MCGYTDALDRGHTVEDMMTRGFSIRLDPETGKGIWKVGEEMAIQSDPS